MARPATGSVRLHGGQWRARLTLADGSRSGWLDLDPAIAAEDEAGARACAAELAALARKQKTVSTKTIETVAEYSVRWIASRRERGLASVDDDASRLACHVLPVIGALDVRTINRDALEGLVEKLDAKVRAGEIAWKTAIHIWALTCGMFDSATDGKLRRLRVREDNPATRVHGPDRGTARSKCYLFPSEFTQLLECDAIPVSWRRLFALTTYLSCRAAEVAGLRWESVDLDHGIVHIHETADRKSGARKPTKSKASRKVPIEPTLAPLLRQMHEERDGGERVSPVRSTDRKLSQQLRRCLHIAGLDRAELFADDATRKPLSFHDLRATGITWALVRGDAPFVVMARAGHTDFETTQIYAREAENLRGAAYGTPFPPLPASILVDARGLSSRVSSKTGTGRASTGNRSEKQWRRRESNPGPKITRLLRLRAYLVV